MFEIPKCSCKKSATSCKWSEQIKDNSRDVLELSRTIKFFDNPSFSAKLEHSTERHCLGGKNWLRMNTRNIKIRRQTLDRIDMLNKIGENA